MLSSKDLGEDGFLVWEVPIEGRDANAGSPAMRARPPPLPSPPQLELDFAAG